ncbi:MAG: 16S rRNA (uracil(1498)-N(3))-methyltransferase [Ruminococcaceae bacterium]|nr:16S rRNA (uracil(1498)-N(3))-methyltransferase [Oscillospiraceae bacterium]
MPRFFVRQERVFDGLVSIIGEDAHHIARSLRMAIGDALTVCDMQGNEYSCTIESFDEDKEVVARILSVAHSENEPKIFIKLYQALPKGDKLDTIIQKAVECGASQIIPFQSERCVVKIKNEAEDRKNDRRQRIAAEAAKQCGRSVIPEVCAALSFNEAIAGALESELCLFCYEGDGTKGLGEILREYGELPKSISVVIGSEGGFSQNEVKKAKDAGAVLTGLGKRILRTETASGFVLACLVCASEL